MAVELAFFSVSYASKRLSPSTSRHQVDLTILQKLSSLDFPLWELDLASNVVLPRPMPRLAASLKSQMNVSFRNIDRGLLVLI